MLIPTPLSTLNPAFLAAFGKPAGLWLPCDGPEAKAYDFSGNSNFGTLNGGITTSGDGVGVLGQSWKMVAASKQYIEIPKAIVLSPPATFVAVFNTGNATLGQDLIAVCTPSSDTDYMRLCISGSGTSQLEAIHRSSGSQGIAMSVAGATSNAWHMAAAVFSSNSSRSIYLDSAAPVTDSTSVVSMATLTRTDLGRLGRTSDTSYLQGVLALGIVFPVALSAAQVSALYSSLLYGEPYRLFESSIIEQLSLYASVSHGTIYNKSLSDIITLSENIVDNKVKILSLIDSILFSDTAIGLDPKIVRILLSYKNILLGGGISDEF